MEHASQKASNQKALPLILACVQYVYRSARSAHLLKVHGLTQDTPTDAATRSNNNLESPFENKYQKYYSTRRDKETRASAIRGLIVFGLALYDQDQNTNCTRCRNSASTALFFTSLLSTLDRSAHTMVCDEKPTATSLCDGAHSVRDDTHK